MTCAQIPAARRRSPILWRRSLGWLVFLGPFFFITYGAANEFAAIRDAQLSLVFDWEKHIPFIPWTIIPYWSIDLLYGLSFLCVRGKRQVDRHAFRLIAAQTICVVCFFLAPMRFSFDRPEATGLAGDLLSALSRFDMPYNQAPSLHIALLVLIWFQFARLRLGSATTAFIHLWALLIAVSVLTTWQHHFIDVPTGAAVGALCLWLWPEHGASLFRVPLTTCSRRRALARRYLVGAIVLFTVAVTFSGALLLLAWPAVSLLLVALNYYWAGARGFQKQHGRHSFAVRVLLAPYLLCAWLNSRIWTWRHPAFVPIAEGVYLGRHATTAEFSSAGFIGMLDLAVELPSPCKVEHFAQMPWLDLTVPTTGQLQVAVQRVEELRRHGRLLVACALGVSRSAAALAAWLYWSGRAKSMDEAVHILRRCRPCIVLSGQWPVLLAEFQADCERRKHAARSV